MIGRDDKIRPFSPVAELDADRSNDDRMTRIRKGLREALEEDGATVTAAELTAELDAILAIGNRLSLLARLRYLLDE